MSRKLCWALSLLAGVAGFVGQETAMGQQPCYDQSGHPRMEQFHYDSYRNNRWPQPFRGMDTMSVLNYFEVQKNNGWKLHNTLGASMFDVTDQTLTLSGKSHLKWIVTEAPQNRRVIFVLQGRNQQETAQRVEATQLAISELVPVGPLPTIYLTNRDAPGSSGAYQSAVVEAMNSSIPSPRLAADSGGS